MIEIKEISKKFRLYGNRKDRIKEWLSLSGKLYHQESWALKNINLCIPAGEVFGIIGMNGAGKSTLLKILTGTMSPSSGKITMAGKVAALLELGTGFHEELTGRENVLINGKILGLDQSEISSKLAEIAAFSELGDYFDKPVRTYSTGMYVRLAFSLASCVRPDVLIIDEALSVGDAYFQQKCLKRIEQFKQENVTILFVSHDLGAVKLLCDRVAILDEGQIKAIGKPIEMLELYNAFLSEKNSMGKEYVIEQPPAEGSQGQGLKSGNRQAIVRSVLLRNEANQTIFAMEAGQECKIEIKVDFRHRLVNPTIGILIRDRMGYDIFGTNTAHLFTDTGLYEAGDEGRFIFHCPMNLGPGEYTITVAVHADTTHIEQCYEWADRILSFKVLPRSDFQFLGVTLLQPKLSMEKGKSVLP